MFKKLFSFFDVQRMLPVSMRGEKADIPAIKTPINNFFMFYLLVCQFSTEHPPEHKEKRIIFTSAPSKLKFIYRPARTPHQKMHTALFSRIKADTHRKRE